MTEEQNLVRASREGDCRAFERLVEKYQMTITIPTKEEYKRQKESAPVESLPHNP